MTKHTRAIHIDFHTPDGVIDFGSEFSAAEFAQTLKDAKVNVVTAFAQCNFGYAYFKTEIGTPYPHMKGDMLRDIIKECHARGVKVNAYINVGINNVQAEKNSNWCRVNANGQIYTGNVKENWQYRAMCYNTPYRKFLLDMIEEIATKTDCDGIFCDCMSFTRCYCPECLKKLREQGIDINDDDAVLKFNFNSFLRLGHEIRKVVPKDKDLVLSGMPYEQSVPKIGQTHFEIESLPGGFGGWSHDYIGTQASYQRNICPDALYMSGRFHASWGDFGGIKEKASMENDLFDALIYNIGFSIGDHMNPRTGLIKSLYKTVGEVFTKAEFYEKYTEGAKYCADIGVVRNKIAHNLPYLADEHFGCNRVLTELGYTFDIINEDMDFSKYKLLILPDNVILTDTLKDKLKEHIAKNKGLISSAYSLYNKKENKFMLDEYDFITPCGLDEDTATCYKFTDSSYGDTSLDFSDYALGILMKAKNKEDVIAKRIEHYCDDVWDRPYFDYRWTEHHLYTYLAPSGKSSYDAVILNKNICHIGFEIFSGYNRHAAVFHKQLLDIIIKKLMPLPVVKKEDLPSTSKISLTETEEYKLLNVKVTYPEPRGKWFKVVEEHNAILAGKKVKVLGKYSEIKCVETGENVPFEYDGTYTTITLPEIVGFSMFKLS